MRHKINIVLFFFLNVLPILLNFLREKKYIKLKLLPKSFFLSVISKICQSASSLIIVEAGPHEERPYPTCVTHAIEEGELVRCELSPLTGRELATCKLSPLVDRKLATYELSPLASQEPATYKLSPIAAPACELSPLAGRELTTYELSPPTGRELATY